MKAVFPGSFDPMTYGHIHLIERAAKLLGNVTVLVAENTRKGALFSVEERVEMARMVLPASIEVHGLQGLLADYVQAHGITAIIRGVRSNTDFDYEFQMAWAHQKLCPQAETLFMTPCPQVHGVSSSLVKEVARLGGDPSAFVPTVIAERLRHYWQSQQG